MTARTRREPTMEGLLSPMIDLEGGVEVPALDDFRPKLVDRYHNVVAASDKAKGKRGTGGGPPRKSSTSASRAVSLNGGSCKLSLEEEWVEKASNAYLTRDELSVLLNMKVRGQQYHNII
jgi:hypothetical protein